MSTHGVASGTMGLDAVAPLPGVAPPVAQLPALAGLPRPHPLLATPQRVLKMRSDAALAERFRAGDQEAFAVLYERHRATVLAVCIGVLGSRHDAEDAAQDSFAALAVALRTSPPRDLRAWLARVARNAAIDVIRRRRAVTSADDDLESQAPSSTEVRAEFESVLAGLRELPESQRMALLMRELGGHTYREIGDLLELDEAAVRGLIARGRMGLRAHREATEMSCAAAREALAGEPDGRHRDRTVRRHLRSCASCRAYGLGLRKDARSLRSFAPAPMSGVAGGSAIFGGFAVKTALTGGVLSQVTAACAVSACAVGGFAFLYPHTAARHRAHHATAAPAAARSHSVRAGGTVAARAVSSPAPRPAPSAPAAPGVARSSAPAARTPHAPASAAKIISTASVVLSGQYQLPGSQGTSAPTSGSPASGLAPTSPTASPTGPVSPAPSRWGVSPAGYPASGWDDPSKTGGGDSGSSGASQYGGSGAGTGSPAGAGTGTSTGTSSGASAGGWGVSGSGSSSEGGGSSPAGSWGPSR